MEEKNLTMGDFEKELDASMREIQEGEVVEGTVVGISDTEVMFDFGYFSQGIIPANQLSDDPSFSIKAHLNTGDSFKAMILKKDDGYGNVVLSKKAVAAKEAWAKLKELQDAKATVEVTVKSSVKGGLVGYLEGLRAFVPASKVALGFVEDLEQFVGQVLECKIITLSEEEKKLVLSARDVLVEKEKADKLKSIEGLEEGAVVDGVVESLQTYGAFVNIGNGVTGLLHVSQISHKRVKEPASVLKEGDQIQVKIIGLKDGRISLSKKALEEETRPVFNKEKRNFKKKEDKVVIPKAEDIATSLGSLLKNLHLDK